MTWAIMGILFTVILSLVGYILTIKSKQKTRLEFKKRECYSVFNSVVEKLKIDIHYQDKKITNPLILFKGEISNTGSTDIDKQLIRKPIKLITNENYEWLEVYLLNGESETNAVVKKINQKEIAIEWDLLKKGEKVEFEALIEVKDNKDPKSDILGALNFYASLKFEHRITNLDKIICEDQYKTFYVIRNFRRVMFSLGLVSLIFGLFTLSSQRFVKKYLFTSSDVTPFYELSSNKNNAVSVYTINIHSDDLIVLKDKTGKKLKSSLNDFNSEYTIKKVKYTKENLSKRLYWVYGIFFSIFGLLVLIAAGRDMSKELKKIKALTGKK